MAAVFGTAASKTSDLAGGQIAKFVEGAENTSSKATEKFAKAVGKVESKVGKINPADPKQMKHLAKNVAQMSKARGQMIKTGNTTQNLHQVITKSKDLIEKEQ